MAILAKKLGSLIGTLSALTVLPIAFAKPASAALVYGSDIVTNGSFEDITAPFSDGNWGIFKPNTTGATGVTGWGLLSGSLGSGIEVQKNNVAGKASQGNNLVELDSNGNTGIFQTLNTIVGQTYQLSFDFSARPGTVENLLNVKWGDQLVTSKSANGSGVSDTKWTNFTYNLVATAATTRISFDNFGSVSDTYGTYIDNIRVSSVTSVPESGSIMGLLAFGAIGATSLRKRKHQKVTIQA